MDWQAPLDGYCERLGPGLWAEPANLVTNVAFLAAAGVMWRRCRGMPEGRVLAAILAAIGLGSGLFHAFATRLTALMDLAPILAFILVYLFLAMRDFLGFRPRGAALATLTFLPYAVLTVPQWARLHWLGSSAGYMPVPVLILGLAAALARRAPATAKGMAAGAGILLVSLTFRTLDAPLCALWPLGTHALWHLLNAVMLAWMIEVWRRHRASAPGT